MSSLSEDNPLLKLTDAQAASVLEAFTIYGTDEGLEVGKLIPAFKKCGQPVTQEFMEKHDEEIDEHGTGFIDFEMFETLVRKKMQADEDERELKDVFRILDKEKKGEVHTDEIRWILKGLGDDLTEEDIDDMIAEVDTDGSGWVDFDEFKGLMMGDD